MAGALAESCGDCEGISPLCQSMTTQDTAILRGMIRFRSSASSNVTQGRIGSQDLQNGGRRIAILGPRPRSDSRQRDLTN